MKTEKLNRGAKGDRSVQVDKPFKCFGVVETQNAWTLLSQGPPKLVAQFINVIEFAKFSPIDIGSLVRLVNIVLPLFLEAMQRDENGQRLPESFLRRCGHFGRSRFDGALADVSAAADVLCTLQPFSFNLYGAPSHLLHAKDALSLFFLVGVSVEFSMRLNGKVRDTSARFNRMKDMLLESDLLIPKSFSKLLHLKVSGVEVSVTAVELLSENEGEDAGHEADDEMGATVESEPEIELEPASAAVKKRAIHAGNPATSKVKVVLRKGPVLMSAPKVPAHAGAQEMLEASI